MTKILLVEDDKSLREIYGVRLLAEGYDIVSAGDGEEALAMAIKERPRLILSDVMMPKISGFDMLDILRSTTETKDVKVIMMTALSSEDQRKRGEQLGADRYLVKSQVGIEDVVRAVHEVLRDVPGIGTEPKPSAAAEPDNSSQDMSYVENLEVDPNDTPSVERPDVESLSPQPSPEEPPVLPTAESPQTPQAPQTPPEPAVSENTAPVLQPVPQISPQSPIQAAPQSNGLPRPASAALQPAQPSGLPQPLAPFSSPMPRPAGLGDRVIQPLPASEKGESVDVSELIDQELNAPAIPTVPTAEPASAMEPIAAPIPQPTQPAPEEPPVLPAAESPQTLQTPPEPAAPENTAPVLQPVPQISPQSPIQAAMQQSAPTQADDPAQQQPAPAPTSMPTADPNAAQLAPQPAAPNPSDAAVLTPAASDPTAAMQQSAQTQADDPAQQQPAPAPTSMPTAPQQ